MRVRRARSKAKVKAGAAGTPPDRAWHADGILK